MIPLKLWLPGWGMLPEVCPAHDPEGANLVPLSSWPGYSNDETGALDALWDTESLLQWLDSQIGSIAQNRPVDVVGWSMGGILALCYADRFPEKIRRVDVWASTACFVGRDDWPGQPQAAVEALYQGLEEQNAHVFERFLKSQVPLTHEFRGVRKAWLRYVQSLERPGWAALKASLRWLNTVDIRHRLSHIHVPVGVHHGTEDAIIPMAAGKCLAESLPDATWHMYQGRGHAVWLAD